MINNLNMIVHTIFTAAFTVANMSTIADHIITSDIVMFACIVTITITITVTFTRAETVCDSMFSNRPTHWK